MFGIADANFFTSSFGVQTDRFVSKHREADHSFISDDFDTVLTGRIMGNKAPGAAANQSVIKLKASAQCIFGGVKPSAVAFISAGFEDAAEHVLQQINLVRGKIIKVTASCNISLYAPGEVFTVVIQITWRLGKTDLYVDDITTISFTFWK